MHSNSEQNQNSQSEFGFAEQRHPFVFAETAPAQQAAFYQSDDAIPLNRYLVVLADEYCLGNINFEDHEIEHLFHGTACVLARSIDEAFFLAADDSKEDGIHRPVVALTAVDLRAMADTLDGCPLSADRRSIATLGGYASLAQLKNSVPADQKREEESQFISPEITAYGGQDKDDHGGNFTPDGMIGYVEVVCFDKSDLLPSHAEITKAAWSRFGSSSCIGKAYVGNDGDEAREFTRVRYPVFASSWSLWEAASNG